MLLINRILSPLGLQIWRSQQGIFGRSPIPRAERLIYEDQLKECANNHRGFVVKAEPYYDAGHHPADYRDVECAFAASHLFSFKPDNVLDIGSYRHFILGLLSGYNVTTVDVRNRSGVCNNEIVVSCDAKKLQLPNDEFDAVVSLCTLEHFGLGRYGDEFDLDADIKAMNEMKRVLKPEGWLIFSTNITQATPTIAFNAHRIYSCQMIHDLCYGLALVEETVYSLQLGRLTCIDAATREPGAWDVYLGVWRKSRSAA